MELTSEKSCCSAGNNQVDAPVFLPGESHGQGSLVGCSPWGCKELDTTEATDLDMELDLDKLELDMEQQTGSK